MKNKKNSIVENQSMAQDDDMIPIFHYIYIIIVAVVFIAICIWFMITAKNNYIKIIFIPFLICGIAVMVSGFLNVLRILNKKPAEKIKIKKMLSLSKKVYLIGFSIFWFGFLIVFDVFMILQRNVSMLIFSLVFWVVGISVITQNWKYHSK